MTNCMYVNAISAFCIQFQQSFRQKFFLNLLITQDISVHHLKSEIFLNFYIIKISFRVTLKNPKNHLVITNVNFKNRQKFWEVFRQFP